MCECSDQRYPGSDNSSAGGPVGGPREDLIETFFFICSEALEPCCCVTRCNVSLYTGVNIRDEGRSRTDCLSIQFAHLIHALQGVKTQWIELHSPVLWDVMHLYDFICSLVSVYGNRHVK